MMNSTALISTVNKIHDVASKAKKPPADLPQIVVHGDQSSGKSSVLEGLVGRSFLPRGRGIMTRCPIIVQMIPVKPERKNQNGEEPAESAKPNATDDEWVEFLHTNRRFTDFGAVKEEIQAETDRSAGGNKGISKKPITVKIFSPRVVQLTVIDLPGYTRVPVGDQPEDIEQQVRELVIEYITKPNTIILCVSQATVDVQTSESIQLARKVDPTGSRTLVVITMLDMLLEGETATETLTGGIFECKLGIIGVINRSNKDVRSEKTIEASIRDERRFLASRYPNIAEFHGTERLRHRLHELLVQHIKASLDDIEVAISGMIFDEEAILQKIGKADPDVKDKRRLVAEVISMYCNAVSSEIFGSPQNRKTDRVAGKEQLIHLFSETFRHELDAVDPVAEATDEKIAIGVSLTAPLESIFFVPDGAFRTLIRRPIEDLMEPSKTCALLAHSEMKQIINTCAEELKSTPYYFPKLNAALINLSTNLLNERYVKAKEIIENYVNIQADSTFTTDTTFLAQAQALKASMDVSPPLLSECHVTTPGSQSGQWRKAKGLKSQQINADRPRVNSPNMASPLANPDPPTANVNSDWPVVGLTNQSDQTGTPAGSSPTQPTISMEPPENIRREDTAVVIQKRKCEIVRELMRLYFNIVRKCHQDYVPKALLHTVIYNVVRNLNAELSVLLGDQKEIEELVKPPADVLEKRQNAMENLVSLKEAADLIPQLRLL